MTNRESVKITHAALDEVEGGNIILRGVIDPASLHLLKVGDYQREVLPIVKISELVAAFKTGAVPDVDLGMRGGDVLERDDAFYLQDEVFIVDGLQRVTAGIHMMKTGEGTPRLGAAVYFNTTEEWERNRFKILNVDRSKLSPNILMRNLRQNLPVLKLLYDLTTTEKERFVLYDRVCWAQRMQRRHITTALTLAKVLGSLHAHIGPGRAHRLEEMARGLQQIFDRVGRNTFMANTIAFFNLIDECWGIRSIVFKEGSVYMRSTFLTCLALLFSRHEIFWKGNKLCIEREISRKIASFPVSDPHVIQLASAAGTAGNLLFQYMVDHVNSGKRTKRLTRREEIRRAVGERKLPSQSPPPANGNDQSKAAS